MGQYAASGGYYVAANADKIVAMPTTITGSIGVLGGKLALEDTFARIGYNVEGITVGGEYASAYSGDEPWTQAQRKAFTDQMEDIYIDFTTELGGIEPDAKINLRKFPRPKSRSEQFEELFSASAQASKEISTLREITALPEVQAVLKARAQAEAMARGEAQLTADIGEIQ